MVLRSTLFTPATSPSMMRKALDGEADAVTFDLEDSVSVDEKAAAREHVGSVLESAAETEPVVGVRVNPIDRGGHADLDSLADVTAIEYVVLPKVEDPSDVVALADSLAMHGMNVRIHATVESPLGVENAVSIARTSHLSGLGFGGEDFTAEIGATRTAGGEEVSYARQRIVTAAAIGKIPATDTVYTDLDDLDGLRGDAAIALQFGFCGKSAIHPVQIPVINDVFTPSEAEITRAARIVDGFEEADASVVEIGGQMIDSPVYRRAVATLERARAGGRLSSADRSTGG